MHLRSGPARSITGRTWGGCIEVLQWILTAGRFPVDPSGVEGGVLLLETSEELVPAREVSWVVRALGERGILAAVDAVLVARPAASNHDNPGTPAAREQHRAEQRDMMMEQLSRYNPDAVLCIGIPFGHTRPQWIVPYGGTMTVDGVTQRVWADYA